MNSLVVAFLFLFGLGAIVWLALTRRVDDDADARRRSAEDRLEARNDRDARRRRLGLPPDNDDKR